MISEESKALLSAEQAGELKAYERMFNSAGWTLLLSNLQDEFEAYGRAYDSVTDLTVLGRAQGMRYILNRIIKYPAVVEGHYQAIADGARGDGPELEAPETDDNWA